MLRDVQTDLAPDREPRPALDPGAPESVEAPESLKAPAPPESVATPEPLKAPEAPEAAIPEPALDANLQIRAPTELSEGLIASMRELLAGYERALTLPQRRRAEATRVTMSAGPFASIESLHEFEEALARVRGVRHVVVRGYEGSDRAIIDVRLA